METFGKGADGIIISEVEESYEAELAEKLTKKAKKELDKYGIEPDRIMFQPMVLPIFKVLPKFISGFTEKIDSMGKIKSEIREHIK